MTWVMHARRAGSVLIAAAVLAVPAAARATNACAHLTDCTSVEASSWLAVPAASPTNPGIAGMVMFCPQAKEHRRGGACPARSFGSGARASVRVGVRARSRGLADDADSDQAGPVGGGAEGAWFLRREP
jgi:hypothetical protein